MNSESDDLRQEVLDLYGNEEWKEGLNLEFKSGKGGIPKEFWPTYSAFANTEGGIILLGVADNGAIEGLAKPDTRKKELIDLLNNTQKCSVNVSSSSGMVIEVKLEGKTILAIKVPAADLKDKPVYVQGHKECCFFRQHEADVRCTEGMQEQMIRDKSQEPQDYFIIRSSRIEDIDIQTFQQFRNRMGSVYPAHPWLAENDKDLLMKLGGYRRDRESGKEGVTLAGLLMFGTNESIAELFPQFQVNYYEQDGTEDFSKRWSDRLTADGTWTANLYQFFFKVLPLVSEGLKTPFRLNADMTRQGESSAHVAVREALANALVHADYRGDGGVIIRKTSQGLDLSNPGTLLIPRESLFEGGMSKCRNTSLQKMFQMIGVVDKAGSGVDKIVKGWMEKWLCPPQVAEKKDPARVEWFLSYIGIVPASKQDELRKMIGVQAYEDMAFHEKLVLLSIPSREYIGHKEIQAMLSIYPGELSKHLAKFVAKGYLKTKGRSRGMRYCLADRPIKGEMSQLPDEMSQLPDEMSQLPDEMSQLPDEMSQLPESVLAVRNCRKMKQELLEKAIVDLCRGKWITSVGMAKVFQREKRTLQRILQPMVSHGLLSIKYEDMPNHPQQAYTTANPEQEVPHNP